MRGIEYKGLERIEGPVVITKHSQNVGYNEVVAVYDRENKKRLGRVLDLSEKYTAVQIFGNSTGLSAEESRVEFLDKPMELRVGDGLLGRVFSGLGEPIDGYGDIFSSKCYDINGLPINPYARTYPRDFIQTGISSIDGMNTLIRGQKLPIFSGNGLPHNRLAAQIVRQAKILSFDDNGNIIDGESSQFVIVFCAMGIKNDVARFFLDDFEQSGVLSNVVVFLSLADSPSLERLVAPRCALTAAEYLAFEKNKHVLVVMTDMTNYCEALREVSSIMGEVPSRKGYPGYMYSDLASLYERAGKIKNSSGSITQIPVLTMPNDDISHPIPDLSGYITEGQIVLDRELSQRGIYPPVAGLPSLSRLMKDGIGKGMTREDHADVSSQLFAAYAKVKHVRNLVSIIGEEELSQSDRQYLKFGEKLEQIFLTQGERENRDIGRTLELGWKVLAELPREDLLRVREEYIEKYLP
ncbi:MAG: V-type ATP synthase subunit B [Treponema sp.]|jgi:V/A-type H+-transporting ATPase subunit B|nr:V-type ATP synthase subunit B [Treponema sp.]